MKYPDMQENITFFLLLDEFSTTQKSPKKRKTTDLPRCFSHSLLSRYDTQGDH